MNWSEVATLAAKLAPTIATCIGGPLAGTAVATLEKVFGILATPESTSEQRLTAVASAIAGATPEQLVAIQQAEQSFQIRMAELGFQDHQSIAALRLEDTKDARDMQKNTRSWVPAALTMFVTVGFFGMLLLLMFVNVPESNSAVVYTFTGTLGTAWMGAVHFWFGDTQASTDKTSIIAKAGPVHV